MKPSELREDMNVASLELCRELYQVSNGSWDGAEKGWCPYSIDGGETEQHQLEILTGQPYDYPAYDLGYLLRKLPYSVPNKHNGGSYWLDLCFGDSLMWHASYDNAFGDFVYDSHADTPEDAACKLSIELFKQGVLTK